MNLVLKKIKNNNPVFFLYFIYLNNQDVGFINYLDRKNEIMIYQLEINRNYQRKGIGTKIINLLEKSLRKKEYLKINVVVLRESLDFWKKIGFKIKNYNEQDNSFIAYKMLD